MQDSIVVIALTAGIFIAAGIVKGVLGMGLPTVAIGFLGLVIAPVEAAAMLVLPSLITNVWQLIAGPNFKALSQRFGTLLIGICVGTPIGVSFITSGNTQVVTAGLGIVLTIYGAFGLSAARLTVAPRAEWWLSPLMGFITGILMGATGISALPVAPYFTALDLKKDDLIRPVVYGVVFCFSGGVAYDRSVSNDRCDCLACCLDTGVCRNVHRAKVAQPHATTTVQKMFLHWAAGAWRLYDLSRDHLDISPIPSDIHALQSH